MDNGKYQEGKIFNLKENKIKQKIYLKSYMNPN